MCALGETHRRKVSTAAAVTHAAIAEAVEGKTVDWLEQVSDEQSGADRQIG